MDLAYGDAASLPGWGWIAKAKPGRGVVRFPDWLLKDEPRPSRGRIAIPFGDYYADFANLSPCHLCAFESLWLCVKTEPTTFCRDVAKIQVHRVANLQLRKVAILVYNASR